MKQPSKPDRTTAILLLVAFFVAVGGIGLAVGHLTAPGATAAATRPGAAASLGPRWLPGRPSTPASSPVRAVASPAASAGRFDRSTARR